ncbi:MAG: molybdopterin converting factor subunit 1 [Myxococcaceae bacterium]|nr:MAG: molybdopterin converting factor subunit 1 [Myxococcaceae bacterium]
MSVTVLYFAAARERAGLARESLEVPDGARVSDVLALLAARHPALTPLLPHLRVAVQQQFVEADAPVPQGAELALIPPVAGGAPGLFAVVDRPLVLAEVVDAVAAESAGGLVTFSGEAKLAEIGEEVANQWPGTRLAIVHRVGTLVPGELAVVIAAGSAHRKEAFRGCEHAIERLKQDVPIWKKEFFEDGEVWVGLGP